VFWLECIGEICWSESVHTCESIWVQGQKTQENSIQGLQIAFSQV